MSINTLYVQTQGSFRHETILFLHAFPLASDMWKEQMNFFSKTHYTLAPDLPGFGKGPLPSHAITFEYYVDEVLNFLRESGIKRSIWCGLSMGGYLALRLYERAPELCAGLILANTKATADDNKGLEKRWTGIKDLHYFQTEFMEKQWAAMIGHKALENPSLKKQFRDIVERNTELGVSTGLACLATRMDHSENLPNIQVPTLLIAGEEDKVIKISEMEFLHDSIHDSKLEVIKEVGHLSNLENPEMFNKLVGEFLANLHTMNIQSALMN